VLVFDVGGSHVSAALCAQEGLRLGPIASARYPSENTVPAFLEFLFRLGEEAMRGSEASEGASGVEMAFPGPFDYAAGISRMEHKLPYLFGVDLRLPLAAHFGWEPAKVRFLNDADSYLLGEVGAGAARGIRRCAGIFLGTGIGAGFTVDGRIVLTGKGVPPGGEMWDLPWKGGILEDALSTRALQAAWLSRTGETLEVAEIAHRAAADPDAAAVFAAFGRELGLALRTLLAEFAPEVVVVGGGIARSAHLFLPQAQQQMAGSRIELRLAQLFEHAPLVGAAVAWFAEERNPRATA
jgi:glucokinase